MKPIFYKAFATTFVAFSLLTPAALAADSSADQGFSVRIKDSSLQLEEKLPYFHYQVEPASSYTNTYILENRTSETKVIDVEPVNAFTNPFASFNFSPESKTDLSRFHDKNRKFKSYVEAPKTVTLAPNEKRELLVKINTPEDIEDGEVMGALMFEEQNQGGNLEKTNSTVLESKVNFIISTLLEFEKEEPVKLGFGEVKFNSNYAIPRLEAEIINKNGSFLKESFLDYAVKTKNGKELFTGQVNISRFAPATNVWAPIQWDHKSIKPGDYQIDLTFSSKNDEFPTFSNTKSIELTKEMLQQHQVEYGKEKTVPVVDFGKMQFWILLILVALASAGLAVFWMKRQEKKMEEKYRLPSPEELPVEDPVKETIEPVPAKTEPVYGPQEKPETSTEDSTDVNETK